MPLYRPKLKRKRYLSELIFKARVFIYFLALLVIVGFGLTRDYFLIKKINIKSEDEVVEESFRKSIISEVTGKNIFLFWFLVQNQLREKLLAKYPSISEAKFQFARLEFNNIELILKIEIRQEVGLYCYNKECYFFDKEGYLFKKGDESLERSLPILILQGFSGQPYRIRQKIRSDIAKDLIEIKHFFDNLGLKARIVEFTVIEDYKIYLGNYEAYFLVEKENLINSLLNLKIFIINKLNNDAHYLEKVVYLDARYQDKVFEMLK